MYTMLTSQMWCITVLLSALQLLQTVAHFTEVDNVNVWTAWSPCSTTCGPGVSTRQCKPRVSRDEVKDVVRTPTVKCNGSSTQVKICDLKACPSDQQSDRQASCSLYNSRRFSGRQYVWEPFIHPTDPCKLACRAKGQQLYANLPDKVDDGTPCTLGTSIAVCVNGVCKQVGCDGLVESAAVKDACGVCKGDGSSCQTISGIFTSTDLKPGVNYVISIPGGSTNINITELQANKNFLVLQTVDGKYIINNETSSSTSSVVEAAGTIFRHEAKVPPFRKESITSPGPTNITVVLKIFVRGSNPGILYSFSVLREVGDAVIQQIRHRSRPIEIPPESNNDRSVPDSTSRDGDAPSQMKHVSKHSYIDWPITPRLAKPGHHHSLDNEERYRKSNSNILVKKSPLISGDETSARNGYESTSTTQATLASVSADVVNLNSEDSERRESDLLIARNDTVFHSAKAPNEENVLRNVRRNLTYDQIINRTKLFSGKIAGDVDNLHLNTSKQLKEKSSYYRAVNWSDFVLNRGHRNIRITESAHGIHEANLTGNYVTTPSNLSNEVAANVLKDHQVTVVNDSSHPSENYYSQISVQSKGVHLSSLADPSETENWIPDDKRYDHENDRSSSSDTIASNKSHTTISINEHGAENTVHVTANRNQQTATYVNKLNTISGKENVSKHIQHSVSHARKYNSLIGSHGDGNVNRLEAVKTHPPPVSAVDNSRYIVPRYSQSFKFPHRYKDIYNLDRVGGRPPRSKVTQHHRQHHSQHPHSSLNISTKTSSGHFEHEDMKFSKHSSSNLNRLDSTNSHSTVLVANHYRDATNISSTLPYTNDDIQHNVPDTHKEMEKVYKEMRLHNHNTVIEERKRRLEEQRNRYSERLREVQERIREKQAEVEASRMRSLKDSNISGSFESSHHRKTDQTNTFLLEIPQNTNATSSFVPLQNDSSLTHSKTNALHSEKTNFFDQAKIEPNESLVRTSNNVSLTDPRLQTSQTEMSPHIGDYIVPDVQHQTAAGTQKETASRRHPVKHQHTDFNYKKQNNHGDSREQVTVHHRNQETPSGSRSVHSEPRIILPQRKEVPYTVTENKRHYGNSQAILESNPPRQRHFTDPPSHGAETIPPFSNEFPFIPSMNQIVHYQNSPNQLNLGRFEEPNQIDGTDFSRQTTSLNTHSFVYEWRVSGLTQCTHSCGGGVQQTVIVCVDTITQAVVTDENCRHFLRPKLFSVPCNTRPCSAEWIPGPWSSCTVSCGTGEQTRIATCQARVSPTLNMTMPNSSCEGRDKIPDRQTCNNGPCSSWQVGVWSNCSTSCGEGHTSRNVSCVDLNNHILSDDICTEIRPDSQQPCNLGECGKGWFFTEWNQCSSECGARVVKRQTFCADEEGSTLPDNKCDINQRPPVTQNCHASKLCGALWFTGQWSQCDVKCGPGNRRRYVLCVKELPGNLFAVIGEDNCTDVNKPAEIELCQLSPCVSQWYMTSWNQCSQTCGTGSRTREVRCLDPDQNPADDCPLQTRPKTRESCNTHNCSNVVNEEKAPDCTDKFSQCSVVKRARLCRYNYYKRMCCKSCAEHITTTGASDISSS